jgi:hypothetical protein
VEFPSVKVLAEIENQPAVLPNISAGEIPSEGWTVETRETSFEPDDVWQARGVWELAFAAEVRAARSDLRMTSAMSCVAREVGRYYLARTAPPPEILQQFFLAACGATVPQIGILWLSGEVPAQATDEQVLAHQRGQLKSGLVSRLPANAREAGFWFGRGNGRSASIATFATPKARLTTLSVVPDAKGNVTLEGALLEPADYIIGYANKGAFGVEPCTLDPGVARPRFRAVCHIADSDTTSWVQLVAAPPRRVLLAPIVQILARRSRTQPVVFSVPPSAGSHAVLTTAEFARTILDGLNAVRAQAQSHCHEIGSSLSQMDERLVVPLMFRGEESKSRS